MILKKHLTFLILIMGLAPTCLSGQQLKPGFAKDEYREMLLISARTTDVPEYYMKYQAPEHFRKIYQSVIMGLDNNWDLWISDRSVAVISIRGTTGSLESWLANFYCAMVPAKGELKLSPDKIFTYDLASNPKAAVHVGWLLCMACLSYDMLPKIDSLYKTGVKDFILTGHSQGGAITYLLTSYLYNLQKQKLLPEDIRIKTYCSAAPKPGNLYYAYDYELMTRGGWAFNVVNTADWVPESPFSVQTINDFNKVNPFINARKGIRKMKFPTNVVVAHVFNNLDKPTKKAQKNFRKYLGDKVAKYVKKCLPDFTPPEYYSSSDYVRTGTTIILHAGQDYYTVFPWNDNGIFAHHLQKAYLYLLDQYDSHE